jgi:hypothetical protein
MNIVSLIMQFLAPAIINKMAGAAGLNSSIATKVLGAAVPAILGGIIGKASQPGGASILGDLLGKQDPGLLGKLGDMIGGADQSRIVDQGQSALGSLLGGGGLGALTGALGKFTGAGESQTKSLLGMVAPAVLGTLGQQQKAAGLDASGLANMLMGQKDNVAAAMPPEFAKLLGGSGLLDGIQSNLNAAASRPSAPTPPPMQVPPAPSFNWIPWIVGIAAAAVLWLGVFGGGGSKPTAPTTAIVPPAQKILAGNVDVGSQLAGVFDILKTQAGGIKDVASAQAALPRLQDAAKTLDSVNGLTGALGAEAKKQLASYVAGQIPVIGPVLQNALKIPGVAAILQPVIDQITARLTGLSKLG